MNARPLIAGLLIALTAVTAVAADWEMAMFRASESAGPLLTRCHYRSAYGYQFTITVRGRPCPGMVEVNLESGQVREK